MKLSFNGRFYTTKRLFVYIYNHFFLIMITRAGIFVTTICTAAMLTACAQTKKTVVVKSGATYAKTIEATEQTTLPGRKESEPVRTQKILLVWKQKETPQTFYWRGEDGWTDCTVSKASKNNKKAPRYQFGENWYDTKNIGLDKIKKGDTLELTITPGGKNVIPAGITADMKNRLFFKTAKTGWLYLPVEKFIKRPPVAMP